MDAVLQYGNEEFAGSELLAEKAIRGEILIAHNTGASTTFYAHPDLLRQVTGYVQDVVWPGWYFYPHGRETVLGYFDKCKDGQAVLSNRNYKDKAWPTVLNILAAKGIPVLNDDNAVIEAYKKLRTCLDSGESVD